MAQFDVYLNSNPATRKSIPYLLDVQAELLDTLATRVMFKIKGVAVVMSTSELADVPNRSLGDKSCVAEKQAR